MAGFRAAPDAGARRSCAQYHHGDIAEILIYRDALDDAQRDVVSTYLQLKHGLP